MLLPFRLSAGGQREYTEENMHTCCNVSICSWRALTEGIGARLALSVSVAEERSIASAAFLVDRGFPEIAFLGLVRRGGILGMNEWDPTTLVASRFVWFEFGHFLFSRVPNGKYLPKTFRIQRSPVGQHQLLISRVARLSLGSLWQAAVKRLARSTRARPPRQTALHHWPLFPVLDLIPTAKLRRNLRLIKSQTVGVTLR